MDLGFASNSLRGARKTSLGCLYAFLAPFFAFGLFFLGTGIHNIGQGKTKEGLLMAGFAILFMAFAGMFLALGIRSQRRNKEQLKFQEEHPDAPWLWRRDWRAGRIRSNDGKSATLFWIMAAAFIGISLPAVLAIPKEWQKGNKPILIALVFPLAGVGLGVAAARATIRMRKFGRSELELHTWPGVIGGTLSGALEIPSKVRPTSGFNLRLLCLRRTTSGSGKNRSTQESILWEEQKTILGDFLAQEREKTGLPVFFNVPFDQPETFDGNPAILWRLEVTADVPGVDYAAQFEVPVFKTADSRADAPPARDPTAAFQPPPEAWTPPAHSRIRLEETPGGETEISFPQARNVGTIFGLLVFLIVWNGFIWLMIYKNAPLLFPITFGLVDLLLAGTVLSMLFHSVRLVATPSQLAIHHRFLLLAWKHVIPSSNVQSIKLKPGMQSGTKVYYNLQLQTRASRKLNAGSGIPDKRHAEWLISQLKQALGITS